MQRLKLTHRCDDGPTTRNGEATSYSSDPPSDPLTVISRCGGRAARSLLVSALNVVYALGGNQCITLGVVLQFR